MSCWPKLKIIFLLNKCGKYFFGSKAFELKLNSQKKLIVVKDTVSEIFIE